MQNPSERSGVIQEALNDNIGKLVVIANYYGLPMQREKFVEELAELIVEIKHDQRNHEIKVSDHFLEEFADVLVMSEQMKLFMNADHHAKVAKIIRQKIDRTIKRLHPVPETDAKQPLARQEAIAI